MEKECKRGHLRSSENVTIAGQCRKCLYLYNKERSKKYPGKVKEYRRNSNKKHPETTKEWKVKNPGKVKEHRRRYAKKNSSRIVKKVLAWKRLNPEKVRASENKRRTAKTKAGGAYTSTQWIALCDKYHNRCLCCGKKKKLTADHVIPVSKGGTSDVSNIQPLCRFCNSSKHNKTTDYRT